jgi:aryl-alcohol dehydrogenase-like predicted oxidoreductase
MGYTQTYPDADGSLAKAFKILDESMDAGFNCIDTARGYGASEGVIGQWMKERGNRKDVLILTKGGHHGPDGGRLQPDDLKFDIETSLKELQTDYIDLYVLHRDDPSVPVSSIIDTLNKYISDGKIKAIGGSNWTHTRLEEANNYAKAKGLVPFAVSNPHYSLAVMVEEPWLNCLSIAGPEDAPARKWYTETQMPVFAYSSLAMGLFSGRFTSKTYTPDTTAVNDVCKHSYCYPVNFKRLDKAFELAEKKGVTVPQIALAFCFANDMDMFCLLGCESREEMDSAIKAFDVEITPEEATWLVED